jgi:hypothetical protein
MTAAAEQHVGFLAVLASPDRSHEIPESADVYGWLCGSWDLDVLHYEVQTGNWNGKDILQTGERVDGTKTRWTFTDITADSFHWRGEALYPHATTWTLEGEFLAKRRRS